MMYLQASHHKTCHTFDSRFGTKGYLKFRHFKKLKVALSNSVTRTIQ